MNNVKPGDLARIVDPSGENHGKQFAVLRAPAAVDEQMTAKMMQFARPGTIWVVQALQPVQQVGQGLSGDRGFPARPGEILLTWDQFLRRIDPPADTMDLLRETELPDEIKTINIHQGAV